jgi:hypothetical protein
MNICHCPVPPGGSVTCRDDQTAICRVVDGEVRAECVDHQTYFDATALKRFLLEAITGLDWPELTPDGQSILDAGIYDSPDGRMRVTFRIGADTRFTPFRIRDVPSGGQMSGSGTA